MTVADQMLTDLDAFVLPWGDSAVITHAGTPATVAGVFDNEYLDMSVEGVTMESGKPAFWCKTSDVPSANHSDTLVITSTLFNKTAVSYRVQKVQVSPGDLGPGFTRYILKV